MGNPVKAIYNNGVITGLAELTSDEIAALFTTVTASGYVDKTITEVSHTVTVSDLGKRLNMDNLIHNEVVLPLDTGTFLTGASIEIFQQGIGITYITAGSGVTIQSPNNWKRLQGQFSTVRATYYGNNVWRLSGQLTLGSYYSRVLDLHSELITSVGISPTSAGSGVPVIITQDLDAGIIVCTMPSSYGAGFIIRKLGTLKATTGPIGFEYTGYTTGNGANKGFGIGFSEGVLATGNTGYSMGLDASENTLKASAGYYAVPSSYSTTRFDYHYAEHNVPFTIRLERSVSGIMTLTFNGVVSRQGASYPTTAELYPCIYAFNSQVVITNIRVIAG